MLKEEFQTIGMEFAKLKITKPSGDVTIIEEIDITGKKLTFDNLKQEFDEVLKEFQADKFLYKQSDEDLKQLENMLFLIA
uniref:Uncharacterized protein n=1 Tax=Acrobeloides nanus TaxID=290746 RepID=A0A914BZ72_9BILA